MTVAAIRTALDIRKGTNEDGALKMCLSRMSASGKVVRRDGEYALPGDDALLM